MKRIAIIIAILLLIIAGYYISIINNEKKDTSTKQNIALVENQKLTTNVFDFYGEENKEMENILINSFLEINSLFALNFNEKIEVYIYPNQREFWQEVFPGQENNNSTTGFADHINNKIHLTSINDTFIKSKEEMRQVPTHELVHILLPHPWIDFREGIAVYLAKQTKDYKQEEIPENLNSIITYQGSIEDIRKSYSFAGWKIKFIIEECLNYDYTTFLEFIDNPDDDLDYSIIGYNNEAEFLSDFKKYLERRLMD